MDSLPVAAGLLMVLVALTGTLRAQGPAFPPPAASGHTSWQSEDGPWLRLAQQPDPPLAAEAQAAPAAPVAPKEPPPESAQEKAARELAEQRATQLRSIASQLSTARSRTTELEKERADREAELKRLVEDGLTEPHPYSFLLLDKAHDDLVAETQSAQALRDAMPAAKDAVTQAKQEQEAKERELRRAKEKVEQSGGAAAAPPLAEAVAEADHQLTVASQVYEQRRLELANLQLEQKVQSLRLARAQKRAELIQKDAVFTSSQLDDVIRDLGEREQALQVRAQALNEDIDSLLQPRWYQARQRLDDAKAAQDESKLAVLEAEVQARDYARQTALLETSLIAEQQQRIEGLQKVWQRRYAIATSSASSAEAVEWLDDAQANVDRLGRDARQLIKNMDRLRKQISAVEKQLENVDASDATLRYWMALSSRSLDQQRKLCGDYLAKIEAAFHVWEKLRDELTSGGLSELAGRWLAEGRQWLRSIWDYELAAVDERRITVGKIVKGVILLLIGIYASRVLSRLFGRRMLVRMGVNASAAAALQSIVFYMLVTLFALFALKLVAVPLTAFTVLGGALALGVGFGSQNIVNNFISGLIMLAERPVRVGDLIQLADVYGNVEHIGARSTRVRTGANLEIIIPNSTFLETNVVNWTLSDNHMRTNVVFGVAYGSPTGKVTHLALKAAANHDRVFDRPAPFVVFADFGDNSLVFELHFWVAVRTLMERRIIESDIRFNIDMLFREAGIVIAFPQRDVHLFTEQPLQVQMAPIGVTSDAP